MILIHQLCEAYHWTVPQAAALTIPQIIMLNHAASVTHERSKKSAAKEAKAESDLDKKDPVVYKGKRLSQLYSDEMVMYYNDM